MAVVQALLAYRDRRRLRPPGTWVDGLHVLNMGAGLPAIVLEAGLANSCLSWSRVQPRLAQLTATYSYDRAGLGWSGGRGKACSLENLVRELHSLLDAIEVPRPFILVAHSFGGLIARCYASCFPLELTGLVLVDPATPEEWMSPNREQRWRLRRAIFFTRAAGVLACFGIVRFGLWLLLLRKKDKPGPISRFSTTLQRIRFELRKIPAELRPLVRAHWSRPGFYRAMAAYLKALPACAKSVASCALPAQLPVTVLSGAHQPSERLAEHAAVATRHIIASHSQHFVHLDEPDLVVNAIKEVLQRLAGGAAKDFLMR
jgi:pimeloyl-ACP methyl ester carboxylesterase